MQRRNSLLFLIAFLHAACTLLPVTPSAAEQQPSAPPIPGEYQTIDQLWAGIDPTADPLNVQVVEQWSADGIDYRKLYFTGEFWEGEPTRVYAIEGAPTGAQHLPGILHIHGGGQTANLDWVTFWARRKYVGLSFDFCGDWRAQTPDRQEFTKWGRYEGGMAQVSGGRWMRPNARHNPWFHWALTARRAITLLQQHPACDANRIGIHGTSVGGTLTWLVAGTDARVKAAVPIYGCGWNTYLTPDQKPEDPVDAETYAWRTLMPSLDDLRTDKNKPLADWSQVSTFELVGTAPANHPPAVRHLRSELSAAAAAEQR